jgi:hypothetical protein
VSATLAAVLALIEAAISEAPAIVADIEKLLGAAKAATPPAPIEQAVANSMAAADAALNTPVK